jgi:hypothetical protein
MSAARVAAEFGAEAGGWPSRRWRELVRLIERQGA